MIDRVARCTADPEHLPGGVLQRTERRQVLVAVPVDLVGAHHDMTPSPGQRLEDASEGHPSLDGALAPIAGVSASNRASPSVSRMSGANVRARQPGADGDDVRHGADHDLTGIAETVRHRR